MRFSTSLLLGLFLAIGVARADGKVRGAEYLKGDSVDFLDVMPKIVAEPVTQEEIDLFLSKIDDFTDWISENRDSLQLKDSGEPQETLRKLRNQPVWAEIDVDFADFMALGVKLGFGKQIEKAGKDQMIGQFKAQIDFMQSLMSSPDMGKEDKAEMQKGLKLAESMMKALKAYPDENLTLFKKNAEALDEAIRKLENTMD